MSRTCYVDNSIFFNGSVLNQTNGTAMGTKVAPFWTTLVLGYLEVYLNENNKLENGVII